MRAQASDPSWTRHHDKKYPNNVRHLNDVFRSLAENVVNGVKTIMVNEPLRAGGRASHHRAGRAKEGSGGRAPSPWKQNISWKQGIAWKQDMANPNPLMAKSSGTDHADAAIQSALRTLDAEGSALAAI